MSETREIWVFSEKPALLAEMIAAGKELGGRVTALVVGPRGEAEQAASRGADHVLWLGETGPDRLVDDYLPTIAGLVLADRPFAVLVGSTRRGRAVAGRLAARLGAAALTDVTGFEWSADRLQATHMIFGGGAVRVEAPRTGTMVATIGPGVYSPLPQGSPAQATIATMPFLEPPWRAKLVERRPRAAAQVNLPAAKRVVCPGRGVAQREDLGMIEDLARRLGAEIGCTRPLAEGLDWLPRERYIGISGAMIRPDLYLGVGVSGQVQHLIGMSESRVVAAINKDPNAPIFASADYGIVGDLYAVVPALIAALEKK